MKWGWTLFASLLLLLCAVGLLAGAGIGPDQDREEAEKQGQAIAAWLLEGQLGELASRPSPELSGLGEAAEHAEAEEASEASEHTSAAPSRTPEPAPVTTVEEAWDEEARKEREETVSPSPLTVDEDLSLELRNETDYSVDFAALPPLPEGLDVDAEGPVVLLMHTHGSESYQEEGAEGYRTQDESKSVIAVGETMAAVLEARGYGVLHDKTLCDYPEYTGAYNRSRSVIQENLEANENIVLVIDIHRDAVEDENGQQMRMACALGDETGAQLMLVVGSDGGGLSHPDWQENLSLAAVLQARLDRDYPGLMRPLNLRNERFNQDLAPLDLLVEVGASGNTLEEALCSAEVLADAIADVFDRYSGKNS